MTDQNPTTDDMYDWTHLWEPIETAPRDGSWFVICRAGEAGSCEAGCFRPLMRDTYIETDGGLYRRVTEPIYDWVGFNNFHRATHWIPLPRVPGETKCQEETDA